MGARNEPRASTPEEFTPKSWTNAHTFHNPASEGHPSPAQVESNLTGRGQQLTTGFSSFCPALPANPGPTSPPGCSQEAPPLQSDVADPPGERRGPPRAQDPQERRHGWAWRRYSRGPLVNEEPGPGERGQQPQVIGLVPLDELALHLLRRADNVCFPLKCHLTPASLTEDLWPPNVSFLVTLEDDSRRPVAVGWGAAAARETIRT